MKRFGLLQEPVLACIGSGTVLLPGFRIYGASETTRERVQIGSNSVLGCSITLERSIGMVSIGDRTYIGGSSIRCAERIRIGSDVLIAWGSTIADHDAHSIFWEERASDVEAWRRDFLKYGDGTFRKDWRSVQTGSIHIGDKVWIGFNAIVLKGVTVGEGAVISAGSVVTRDVPPWTLVAGNPAREIRKLDPRNGNNLTEIAHQNE